MNEIKTMNVREIANVLGYSENTIRHKVQELFPESVQNGVTTRLNQMQVQKIKDSLTPRTLAMKSKVNNAVTEIEENQTIANAIMILQRRSEEYRIRAERAEYTNSLLMHSMKLYTVTEIAKELGFRSAEILNKKLEEKKIQYKLNGTWIPTADYSNLGYFEIKQQVHDDTGYVFYDRKVTQEGRKFILDLFTNQE